MQEFEIEVKRLQHLKSTIIDQYTSRSELTPHNTGGQNQKEVSETQTEMLKEYLLHVLQYGTPEERIKILKGVKTRFVLAQRTLNIQ